MVNMYTPLAQQPPESEENNNDSKNTKTSNINNGGSNKSGDSGNRRGSNDGNDKQEPLLDARMGREHKRRQPWHLFLFVSLVKVPSAWQMASVLFIAPDKLPGTYWCKAGQLSPEEVLNDPCNMNIFNDMVPDNIFNFTGNQGTLSCGYSELAVDNQTLNQSATRIPCSSQTVTTGTSMLTSELSVSKLSVPCQDFEFSDGYYSIVDQWQLVCGRKILVPVSQFFYLLGVLMGGIIFTYLIQMWPHRLILIGGVIVQIIAGVCVAVTPYFTLHCALRCITAIACTQMFTAGYSICTGLMEGKTKTVAGCCYEHLWSVGVITLPCLTSLFSDWRHLQLAISLPTAVILFCLRYIPDCPDWKPRKKVRKKKQASLEDNATKTNKATNDMNAKTGNSVEEIKSSHQAFHKGSTQKLKYIGLHTTWIFTVVTYYGGLLNVKNLGPDLFLNAVIAGTAEIAGVLAGLIILLRKNHIWLSLGVINIAGGLCCLLTWTLPEDLEQWYSQLLLLAMLGRIAIACSLTILTLASGNQLPPAQKIRGMFTCVTFARVFLLQAPFIGSLAVYGEQVPLTVFGTYTLLAGLSALTQTVRCGELCSHSALGRNSTYELEVAARQMKENVFRDV